MRASALARKGGVGLAALLLSATLPAQTGLPSSGFEDLDKSIHELIARYRIPGASIAIARNGRLLAARGYGFADLDAGEPFRPETLSRWNSVGKSVTAVATMKLVEEGKLDLDRRVFDILAHIQPYNGRWGDERLREITVRQLLHHTGGWDRAVSGDPLMPPRRDAAVAALGAPFPPSAETVARYTVAQPLDFAPGTRYAYANFGYSLLGLVIEAASGEPYETFVRRNILNPTGLGDLKRAKNTLEQRQPGEARYYDNAPPMRSVFLPGNPLTPGPYAQLDFENILAVGGWLGSVVQLARFAESFEGRRAPAVLRRESVELMAAEVDRNLWLDDRSWYGLGMVVMLYPPVRVWYHGGGSPGSRSEYVRISNGFSYALLFNGEGTNVDAFLSALSDALKAEVQKSRTWPSQDLFPQYLAPRVAAVVDAITFAAGPAAPGSLVSLFGSELNPVTVRVEDSDGVEHGAAVLYSSLTQVNIRLPGEVARGPATLVVSRSPHAESRVPLEIAR